MVWSRFGRVERYIEPFAGSLAVLLANPQPPNIEIVCDLNCMIANFWRSVVADPEAVARYADWPTFHADLTARHKWLLLHRDTVARKCQDDPDWCDPKAAGWWVWGMSHWIGGGFCSSKTAQIPSVTPCSSGGGSGVSVQRINVPFTTQRPHVALSGGGEGVSRQRINVPFRDKHSPRTIDTEALGERLAPWMQKLARRLSNVIVLCRSWQSALSPTLLGNTTTKSTDTAIFMDPPYRVSGNRRAASLYASDFDGTSEDTAVASYNWAVAHGQQFKIAYCCRQGDFDVPAGWTSDTKTMKSLGRQRPGDDLIMFSPRCSGSTRSLFE